MLASDIYKHFYIRNISRNICEEYCGRNQEVPVWTKNNYKVIAWVFQTLMLAILFISRKSIPSEKLFNRKENDKEK